MYVQCTVNLSIMIIMTIRQRILLILNGRPHKLDVALYLLEDFACFGRLSAGAVLHGTLRLLAWTMNYLQ